MIFDVQRSFLFYIWVLFTIQWYITFLFITSISIILVTTICNISIHGLFIKIIKLHFVLFKVMLLKLLWSFYIFMCHSTSWLQASSTENKKVMFLFDVNFVTSFTIFSRHYQKILMNDLKLRRKSLSLYKYNSIKRKSFSSQVSFWSKSCSNWAFKYRTSKKEKR